MRILRAAFTGVGIQEREMVGPNGFELEPIGGVSVAGARRRNPERSEGPQINMHSGGDGRPEWIRTIDLFRVKEAL